MGNQALTPRLLLLFLASPWFCIPALIIPAVVSPSAFAVQYLTLEQAQKALFPTAEQLGIENCIGFWDDRINGERTSTYKKWTY